MRELDKKVVNHPPVIQERDAAIRLYDAQEDSAGAACGTRAECLGWATRDTGFQLISRPFGEADLLFQIRQNVRHIFDRGHVHKVAKLMITDPDAQPFRI